MNITFGASEILIAGGIFLLSISQPVPGWIFVAAGCLGAFFNMAMKMQEKKAQSENIQNFVNALASKINDNSSPANIMKFIRSGNESVN